MPIACLFTPILLFEIFICHFDLQRIGQSFSLYQTFMTVYFLLFGFCSGLAASKFLLLCFLFRLETTPALSPPLLMTPSLPLLSWRLLRAKTLSGLHSEPPPLIPSPRLYHFYYHHKQHNTFTVCGTFSTTFVNVTKHFKASKIALEQYCISRSCRSHRSILYRKICRMLQNNEVVKICPVISRNFDLFFLRHLIFTSKINDAYHYMHFLRYWQPSWFR